MAQRLFCRGPMSTIMKRDNPIPEFIILDLGKPTREFIRFLRTQEYHLFTEELYLIELVMQSMQYERDALMELAYSVMAEVDAALGTTEMPREWSSVANAVLKFGTQVYEQLCRHQIYRNGYLYYQFARWLGDDIVMQRLSLEPERGD